MMISGDDDEHDAMNFIDDVDGVTMAFNNSAHHYIDHPGFP